MTFNFRKITYIIVILLLIFIPYWASKNVEKNQETKPIVIGGLFNLTGYGAFAGEASRDGFLMAIEDSGLSTSTFSFKIEDAMSDQKNTVTAGKKLTEIEKAVAVIGPEWTEFGQAVSPVAINAKVPFFSPWVVAEAPFVRKPYYWSMTPSDRPEHTALAEYAASKNIKNIAIVYSDNFWSLTNIQMFKEEIEKKGLKIVSEEKLDQNTKDFRTTLLKVKNTAPELIYTAIADDTSHLAFLKQMYEMKIQIPVGAHSVRANSEILKRDGRELLFQQIYAEMEQSEGAVEFSKKYKARFGKEVSAPSAAAAYDATTLVLKAIASGSKNSSDIIKYVSNTKGFEGYSGPIVFDENGKLPTRKAHMRGFDKSGNVIDIK